MYNQFIGTNTGLKAALTALLLMIPLGCSSLQKSGDDASYSTETSSRPNILLIMVDDLRPEMGAFGGEALTPEMDELAAQGMLFTNAFVSDPVCGPSRASMLTGVYSGTNRFKNNADRADSEPTVSVTLPGALRDAGYTTMALGKVFHSPTDSAGDWSVPLWLPDVPHLSKDYALPENDALQARPNGNGPLFERADVADEAYVDGKIAIEAKSRFAELARSEEPFFMVVGFLRPHLPFSVPEKYWALYDRGEISLSPVPSWPEDTPRQAEYGLSEFTRYWGLEADTKLPLPDPLALQLRHGYLASISYIDAQVGKLLDELEDTGLADNTLVILWGDHGFLLGDYSLWGKRVTLDKAIRSPIILRGAGVPTGQRNTDIVEAVDIMPTLLAAANVELPTQIRRDRVRDLRVATVEEPKEYAFVRHRNMEAVRSKSHLYIAFIDDGRFVDEILFDFTTDPLGSRNVIGQQAETAQTMRNALKEQIKVRDQTATK